MLAVIDLIAMLVYALIATAISYGIAALMKKKPPKNTFSPSELNAPTVAEGSKFPVVFGTPKRLEGYLIAWWGDVKTTEVATRKSHQHVTLGYDYHVGMHILLSHGPIDGVKQIYVGEKLTWPNPDDIEAMADDGETDISINEPELFGGDYREGGIIGDVDVQYGYAAQMPNDYLARYMAGFGGALAGTHNMGVQSLSVDGVPDDAAVAAGDTLTISGDAQTYTVTANATADAGAITIPITPGIVQQANDNRKVDVRRVTSISASRGLVGVILKQVNTGMTPYLKPWAFLVKRTDILDDGSPQWYLAKASINGNLNPSHIIRECLTNTRWGLKHGSSLLDDEIWMPAADKLYDEGFGLSALWEGSEAIEDFIYKILNHIAAVLYQDPQNGRFNLKLIRDDYSIDDLETFGPSQIECVEDFTRSAYGLVPDTVNVKYWDVFKNEAASVSDHDIAVMDIQGGRSVPIDMDYPYITDPALACRVAARDRNQITSFPASMTIRATRCLSHLKPGDVFVLQWPILGIDQLVVRVMEATYGTLTNGMVVLKCIEDVFATQDSLYSTPPDTSWQRPVFDPTASPARLVMETPFYALAQFLGASLTALLDNDTAYIAVGAVAPAAGALDYELLVRNSPTGDFASVGRGSFVPTGLLEANLPVSCSNAVISLAEAEGLEAVLVGDYAALNDELLKVVAVDAANSQVTLARGVLDTVPQEHDEDDRIWFIGAIGMIVSTEYAASDEPAVKVLPRTATAQLDPDDAAVDSAPSFNQRQARPYAPGNVKINSVLYASSFTGQPTVSWVHRDRLQQTSDILVQTAASIGPEAGVTYTLKIKDQNGVLRRTETGLTGTSYLYTEANERADCGLGPSDPLNTSLTFELYSVRDGLDSWQKHTLTASRI